MDDIIKTTLPFWQDFFFYLFVISTLLLFSIVGYIMNILKKKNIDIKLMQQQHTAKIDLLRKEQFEILLKLRQDVSKNEEERIRQWIESEKETLHVLNGVSTLLDLSEKIGRIESDKILKKLDEIKQYWDNK